MSIHMSSISSGNQGCRCSGGDKASELSIPRRFEEAGRENVIADGMSGWS